MGRKDADGLGEAALSDEFDQFDSWNKFMSAGFPRTHRHRSHSDPFWARISRRRFESINLFNIETSGYIAEVTRQALSAPEPDPDYALIVCLSGVYSVVQDGVPDRLERGDMALFDTRLTRAVGGLGDSAHLALMLPHRIWEAHAPAPVLGQNFVMRNHRMTARLARALVLELAQANADVGRRHRPAVVRQVTEVLSLAMADADEAMPETLHRKVLLRNIKSFVRSQLANPELGPCLVAEHFNVSTRYVSQLFAEEDQTLMTYLKTVRIRRAAEMIVEKSSRMQIKDIYHRVGFKTHAHFTSTFSAELGVSPRDYREADRPGRGG
jgi:AraC-like DNA-binding protein